MAITFIGVNTQDSGGAQSLTFSIPGAAQLDDFMIAEVKQSENTGQQIWDDDGGGGNGWIRLAYNRTTSGRDQETAVYYKIHDGSESNPTFTWNTGGTNEQMSGALRVYRGVDTLNPIQDFGVALGTNDANPPNPSVNITSVPATILVSHAATHDDISAVAAPAGYALRSQVWSGTANDHRNHFTADLIGYNTLGAYTPPDWGHSVLNTTPEYHTYTIALQEIQPIGVNDFNTNDRMVWGDTNIFMDGFGFGFAQGTGKVEIWSDVSGTVKVEQTIAFWSNTSISIDTVQGALGDNTSLYVVVTNNFGEVSTPRKIVVGLLPYKDLLQSLSPDHYIPFDGDYSDVGITGPVRNATNSVVGTHVFGASISEDTTSAFGLGSVLDRREMQDSPNMNITINSSARTIMLWLSLAGIQKSLGALWKEGGGVQNLAFLIGIGNVLMAQMADLSTKDNVQAISDFRLDPNRAYCILMRYSYAEGGFHLYIDGRIQTTTSGNPIVFNFDSHSGDIVFGDPDNNLETGGTDIAYAGQENALLAHFATWSDNSANTGALTLSEILEIFQRGATPDDTIASDTEANMQAALNATPDARPNAPLSYRIENPTGGGNLDLDMVDKVFDSRITEHLEWRGSGTLTITAFGTTNIDELRTFTPNGGTVVVNVVPNLTLTGIQDGTEIRIYPAGLESGELDGVENLVGSVFSSELQEDFVDVTIHKPGLLYRKINSVDLTAGDVTLQVKQRVDRQYENA